MSRNPIRGSVLVDTSVFIDFLRDGQSPLLEPLAINDGIVLSQVVRLELLKGARRTERGALDRFLQGLRVIEDFPPPASVEKQLLILHGRGLNLGLPDIIILTDAIRMRCKISSLDREMIRAAQILKIPNVVMK